MILNRSFIFYPIQMKHGLKNDAAKTWELVGILMLSLSSRRYNSKNTDLYHVQGSSVSITADSNGRNKKSNFSKIKAYK